MAIASRTARRLSLAVLLAAVIPLFVGVYIARSLLANVSSLTHNVEVGQRLERSLDLYQELARSIKEGMRYEADAIAAREGLRAAALLRHEDSLREELDEVLPLYPNIVSISITAADGTVLARRDRGRPLDDKTERGLDVTKALSDRSDGPKLEALFATPRARFDELEGTAEFVRMFRQIERSRGVHERQYLQAFALLLGATMLAAGAVGAALARSVTRRIAHLAEATQAVATGNLAVRVPVTGKDEISDLARAFNRMVAEVERSRARIEFLRRIGTWQEMARRLAHEIKNPLTPIQLAVQECHRRYSGDDPKYRSLLDTTLEIVEEEVGTLRRLVTEFSAFARLPRAELAKGDLAEFVRDHKEQQELFSDEGAAGGSDTDKLRDLVRVSWEIPDNPVSVWFDRHMLRRVMANLVRNAAQAIRDQEGREGPGHVQVSLRTWEKDWVSLEVEDDGPGIPANIRESLFDPYVTTKQDGTGLGLAIVKKIVVEHGGTIEVSDTPLGGARFGIRLPRSGTAASAAAREPMSTLSQAIPSRFDLSRPNTRAQ